jgi:hypothetical protein
MADPRAKGVCPECGRVISGHAVGIQRNHADRKFVVLRSHNREEFNPRAGVCLMPGGYRKVPRIHG